MQIDVFKTNLKKKEVVLAMGPESSGNFSVYHHGKIYFCQMLSDLLDEKNFGCFKKAAFGFLEKEKIKPDVILTDLHPEYRTSVWGEDLAKRFGAINIRVQHHLAHIFSSFGDQKIKSDLGGNLSIDFKNIGNQRLVGIACDGTGFGFDEKIWGGEIFEIIIGKRIKRMGHLENQILIGGDLAVREPARMLIGILSKFLDKKAVYNFMKKYYSRNHFEVLCNQLQSRFNCQETSSTARVLDAVAVLLGFSKDIRNKKHGPVLALEKNSTCPYQLKPEIIFNRDERNYILLTTPLFEFLFKNFDRDEKRLAATAQLHLAQGLYEIAKKHKKTGKHDYFFSGGMADNRIMSEYFSSRGFYLSRKIPRGDAGLSFGQIIYYLSEANPALIS